MTTRKKFQEWLNNFPEDTVIEFAYQQAPEDYESYGRVEFKTPDLTMELDTQLLSFGDFICGDGWEYGEFLNGTKYLELGEQG